MKQGNNGQKYQTNFSNITTKCFDAFQFYLLNMIAFSLVTHSSSYYFTICNGVLKLSYLQLYFSSRRNILALYNQHATPDGQPERDIKFIVVLVLCRTILHLLPPRSSMCAWGLFRHVYFYLY